MTLKGDMLPYLARPKEVLRQHRCILSLMEGAFCYATGSLLVFQLSLRKRGQLLKSWAECELGSAHTPNRGACAALLHWRGSSGLGECLALGFAGAAVRMGSFPSNTQGPHKLEQCCSGIYVTSDKFGLFFFLEYCRPTVHYRNS